MTPRFKIGDVVLLSNFNTQYRYNGIALCNWGKEAVVEEIPRGSFLVGPTYYIVAADGERYHVAETMLEVLGGPW